MATQAAASTCSSYSGADDVTIENLTLQGAHRGVSSASGGDVDGFAFRNNVVTGTADRAVYLIGRSFHSNILIEDNLFHSIGRGVQVGGGRGPNTDVVIRNNIFENVTVGIEVREAQSTLVEANQIFRSSGGRTGTGVFAEGAVTVRNNTISGADDGIEAYSSTTFVTGNTVTNNNTGIFATGGSLIEANQAYGNNDGIRARSASVIDNEVYDNLRGINVGERNEGGAVARGNRVYGNSERGVFAARNSLVIDNVIYSNPIGVVADDSWFDQGDFKGLIANNLIFDYTDAGVLIDEANYENTEVERPRVHNNTFYQVSETADAIRVTAAAQDVSIVNNIFSVQAGAVLDIDPSIEPTVDSDFNLFDVSPGAGFARIGDATLSNLSLWSSEVGQDTNSIEGDPLFTNALGPDGLLGYAGDPAVDGGLDNDFHVLVGSPAIDAGALDFAFRNEPAPNGSRINVGAYGNTNEAALSSSSKGVQVIRPSGRSAFRTGQEIDVAWNTIGLNDGLSDAYRDSVLAKNPLAYLRLNEESGSTAADLSGNDRDGTYFDSVSFGQDGVLGRQGDPAAFFDESDEHIRIADFDIPNDFSVSLWFNNSEADGSGYQYLYQHGTGSNNYLYVALGESSVSTTAEQDRLVIRLVDAAGVDRRFVLDAPVVDGEWHNVVVSVDTVDGVRIYLDGQLSAQSDGWSGDFDPGTEVHIGSRSDRNHRHFYGGRLDEFAMFGQGVSPTEVEELFIAGLPDDDSRLGFVRNPLSVDLIDADTGAVAVSIGGGLVDNGGLSWTIPTDLGLDGVYRIRVASEADAAITGESAEFGISGVGGRSFYVNLAGDTDFSNNSYTTAAGDNANDGLAPETPVASLPVLLSRYGMGPGDVIFVDTGDYALPDALVLTASHAGVRITGPTETGRHAVLSLTNGSTGSRVVDLKNADGVTLENLTLTNGDYGVIAENGSDSDGVTLRNLTINSLLASNPGAAIFFDSSNDNATVTNSQIDAATDGVVVLTDAATITHNTISAGTGDAVRVVGHRATVSDNTIDRAGGFGVSVHSAWDRDGSIVSDNVVSAARTGIGVYGEVLVTGNRIENNVFGIEGWRATVQGNELINNPVGIQGTDRTSIRVLDNRIASSNIAAVSVGRNSEVIGNSIYSSETGVQTLPGFFGEVRNNLIYSNDLAAIEVKGGGSGDIDYRVFERDFFRGSITSIDTMTPVATGSIDEGLDLSVQTRARDVALSYTASIEVPTTGEWTFHLLSNDGSRLYLDGSQLILNDGVLNSLTERSATLYLEAGRHDFQVDVFNDNSNSGPELRVEWEGPGLEREVIALEAYAASFGEVARFTNNTILHSGDAAVRVVDATEHALFENNIITAESGVGYAVADDSQNGFESDYNTIVGRVADWGGVAVETLTGWTQGLGFDRHSSNAEPLFVDNDGADNRLGAGLSDEPQLAQGRLDYRVFNGAFSSVNEFADQTVSDLLGVSDTGFDIGLSLRSDNFGIVFEGFVEVPADGEWTFSTTSDDGSVLWINGELVVNNDGLHGTRTVSGTTTLTAGVHEIRVAYFEAGGGENLSVRWAGPGVSNSIIPLSSLFRNERGVVDGGEDDDFRVLAGSPTIDAGSPASPLGSEPTPNGGVINRGAFGGTINAATSADATLRVLSPNAYELVQVAAGLPVEWVSTGTSGPIDIELIDHSTGGVVATIATAAVDTGSFDYTIDPVLAGENAYRVRVTSTATGLSDESDRPFKIVPETNAYYVNVPNDTNLGNNEYTTAAGSNFNTGTSPDAPLASLAKLLQAYTLAPGDVVYVDSGTYSLLQTARLDSRHHGVTVQGPVQTGNAAVLDRGNTTAGKWGIEFAGADGVTLASLGVTNALIGVYAADNADSDDLVLTGLHLVGNGEVGLESAGAWIGEGNDRAIVEDGRMEDNTGSAVYFGGEDGQALRNEVSGVHERGVSIASTASNAVLRDNNISGVSSSGIHLPSGTSGHDVRDNTISALAGEYGIFSQADTTVLVGNTVTGGTVAGIFAESLSQDGAVLIDSNTVTQAEIGIDARNRVTVSSNTVTESTTGIKGDSTVEPLLISDNDVALGGTGILVGQGFRMSRSSNDNSSITVSGNRVYANTAVGIQATQLAEVAGNRVYSNQTGIQTFLAHTQFQGRIVNNFVYDNTDFGIVVQQARLLDQKPQVLHNTVYQIAGDAVRLQDDARNVVLASNLLWVEAGFNLNALPGNTTDFISDRNLFFQGEDPNARAVSYNGSVYDVLADWKSAGIGDANSVEGDPLFADLDGADNVLGYSTAGAGEDGGPDDNPFLTIGSPAIDAADTRYDVPLDHDGISRLDDPGTPDTGNLLYRATTAEPSTGAFRPTYFGVAQEWQADDEAWELVFANGFEFTFFGVAYDRVMVSSNGLLQFGSAADASSASNSASALDTRPRIAALWDDLTTAGPNDDIYVDTSLADRVAIRWDATNKADGSRANATVVLFDDGRIEFGYGPGNKNLTPTVGLSNGLGQGPVLLSYDGATDLNRAQPVSLVPQEANITSQWATSVRDFSSQFGSTSFAAHQVLGPADTFSYRSLATAWAAGSPNDPTEFLEVGFDLPVYANGVTIRENFSNGFVRQVDVVDLDGVRHTVWTGQDPSQPGSVVDFRVDFVQTDFLVNGVYVLIDGQHSTGYEEVDAIQLHGVVGVDEATALTETTPTAALGQWASTVIGFSSEFSSPSFSADQTLGLPNTFTYGSVGTAWAPRTANEETEFLELGFAQPIYANGVTVRENQGNGFVAQIDVLDLNGDWHTVWAGEDDSPQTQVVDFRADFAQTDFLVNGVRIVIDGQHSTTFEEVDAVRLHGVLPVSAAASNEEIVGYAETPFSETLHYPTIFGDPLGLRGDNVSQLYLLPAGFSFPFYGENRTSVHVSSNGLLQFDVNTSVTDSSNTASELQSLPRIAALWDDLRTDRTGDDVYVDTSLPDRVTFLWDGVLDSTEQPVTFATTLFANGDIRFDYGPGNDNLSATVGVSKGNPLDSQILAYSDVSSLDDVDSLKLTLGNSFGDIGAFEFRGSSLDVTPPTTVGADPQVIEDGGVTNQPVGQFTLTFSEPLNPIDAEAPANYELRNAGPNRILGDGDDTIAPLLASYSAVNRSVSLSIVGGAIEDAVYQLTVFGLADRAVRDLSGLVIDGDRDGVAGGNYTRVFEIDTTAATATIHALATNDRTPDLTGTVDDPAAEVFVRLDGRNYVATNFGDGTWRLPGDALLTQLSDGVYDVEVTTRDLAGNLGADTTFDELSVDATAPVVSFTGFITSSRSPELTGGVDDPTSSVQVFIDDAVYNPILDGSGGWTLPAGVIDPPLPDAEYVVVVRATDVFGNVGTMSDVLTIAPDDVTSPVVAGLFVGSSSWTSQFGDHLESQGLGNGGYYRLGSPGEPTGGLTWVNLDRVRVQFSEDVDVEQADLLLSGVAIASYGGEGSSFSYDPQTFSATLELTEPIGADTLLFEIAAGAVADKRGNLLETSVQSSFAVLPGDVSGDGVVLGDDLFQVRARQFEHATQAVPTDNYSPHHDLDGNGVILSSDVGLARLRQFTTLPVGDPTSALVVPLSSAVVETPLAEVSAAEDQVFADPLADSSEEPAPTAAAVYLPAVADSPSDGFSSAAILEPTVAEPSKDNSALLFAELEAAFQSQEQEQQTPSYEMIDVEEESDSEDGGGLDAAFEQLLSET